MTDMPPAALIGRGSSSDVYRLADGRVLKLYTAGMPERLIAREEAAAAYAAACGLPTARPLGRMRAAGRDGLLFDHIDGRTMLKGVRFRLIAALAALGGLALLHARVHAVPPAPGLRRQRDQIANEIRHNGAPPHWKTAAEAALAALPDGDRLCHGDVHPGNVIATRDGLTLIDWCKASIGHPAADAVRTELLIRFAAHGGRRIHDRLLDMVRDLLGAFYVRRYARATGTPLAQLRRWRLPLAVAWADGMRSTRDAAFRRMVERMVAAEAPHPARRGALRLRLPVLVLRAPVMTMLTFASATV
ncbi:MAG: phosphotransferase [Sphingomonas fennica]